MSEPAKIRVDDLEVDCVRRQVRRNGRHIPLTALSFDTLCSLIEAGGQVVSFDDLIERAWGGAVVSPETVSQRIRLLRCALDDDGRNPRYIESVRGRGYRLLPPVTPARGPWRPTWRAALSLLALAALGVGAFVVLDEEPRATGLAVSAPSDADLIERGWVYLDRHQAEDNRIARRLFLRALELNPGSAMAKAGLSLTLSQAVSKFNAPVSDAIQARELARSAIAERPQHHLGYAALAASLDAEGQVEPAIRAYEQALALAPDHHGIRSSLAYLYQIRGRLVEALELSLAAARDASALHYVDLQIAETLRLLGFGSAAEPWLVRADELKPDNVFAAQTRARHLLALHRFDEADSVLRRAVARGVDRPELQELIGMIALIRGDRETAIAGFRRALSIDRHHYPARTWLAVIAEPPDPRVHDGLVAEIQAAIAGGDTWPSNYLMLADLHASMGRNDQALAALHQLIESGFRDFRLLRIRPTLDSLHGPVFEALMASIEADMDRQRAEVIGASWMPEQLLAALPAERDR